MIYSNTAELFNLAHKTSLRKMVLYLRSELNFLSEPPEVGQDGNSRKAIVIRKQDSHIMYGATLRTVIAAIQNTDWELSWVDYDHVTQEEMNNDEPKSIYIRIERK